MIFVYKYKNNIMKKNNSYYLRCKYLKTVFIDKGISSYCKYFCTLYGHIISTDKIKTFCCISNSPYTEKNCKYFKDKSGYEQTTLGRSE